MRWNAKGEGCEGEVLRISQPIYSSTTAVPKKLRSVQKIITKENICFLVPKLGISRVKLGETPFSVRNSSCELQLSTNSFVYSLNDSIVSGAPSWSYPETIGGKGCILICFLLSCYFDSIEDWISLLCIQYPTFVTSKVSLSSHRMKMERSFPRQNVDIKFVTHFFVIQLLEKIKKKPNRLGERTKVCLFISKLYRLSIFILKLKTTK